MAISKSLGEAIRQIREANGQTQEQVSAGGGMSNRHYQDIEGGKIMPSLDMVFKVARGLGMEADKLIAPVWQAWKVQGCDPRPSSAGD
ncbi:helix-turn-helix domain-containing protein [Exilibacterium tricleocarpae]|nr:helix-turn-helix transcriptional regulator [Exilibacterium tricleocarpae]